MSTKSYRTKASMLVLFTTISLFSFWPILLILLRTSMSFVCRNRTCGSIRLAVSPADGARTFLVSKNAAIIFWMGHYLQWPNVERLIFQNCKISNIKLTKEELIDFSFFLYLCKSFEQLKNMANSQIGIFRIFPGSTIFEFSKLNFFEFWVNRFFYFRIYSLLFSFFKSCE